MYVSDDNNGENNDIHLVVHITVVATPLSPSNYRVAGEVISMSRWQHLYRPSMIILGVSWMITVNQCV